jgi:fatty-acyl-CoA synthase
MKENIIERSAETAPRRRPSAAKAWLKAIELTSRVETEPHHLFADVVEAWASQQADRPALLSDSESFTYGALAARINQYARWARHQGIGHGRTVCLIMPNRPDYIACWLGISRVGGTVALINIRLVGQSLAHCINVAQADDVIVDKSCLDMLETARPRLARAAKIWISGEAGANGDLDAALVAMDASPSTSASFAATCWGRRPRGSKRRTG